MGWSRYGDKGTVQKILVVKYDGKISLGRWMDTRGVDI
jgi:hypothetical protein